MFTSTSGADPDRGESGLSHGQIFPLGYSGVNIFKDIRLNILHDFDMYILII